VNNRKSGLARVVCPGFLREIIDRSLRKSDRPTMKTPDNQWQSTGGRAQKIIRLAQPLPESLQDEDRGKNGAEDRIVPV
jgi:hypothetical protein